MTNAFSVNHGTHGKLSESNPSRSAASGGHSAFSRVLCVLPLILFPCMMNADAGPLHFVLSAKDGNTKMEMSFLDDGTVRVDKYTPNAEFESRILSCLELDAERQDDGLYLLRYVHLDFPEEDDYPGYPVNPYACCSCDDFAFFKGNKKIQLMDVVGHRGLRVTMWMHDFTSRMTKKLHDSDWNIWIQASSCSNGNTVLVNGRFEYTNSGNISVSPIRSEWGDGCHISQQRLFKLDFNDSWRISTAKSHSPQLSMSTNDIVANASQLGEATMVDFTIVVRNEPGSYTEEKHAEDFLFLSFQIFESKSTNHDEYALIRDIRVRWPADGFMSASRNRHDGVIAP